MFLLFCTSAIVSMTWREGYGWVLRINFFLLLGIWLDGFLYGLGFDWVQGLLDQRVGSEGWRQSPVMGGIRYLLRPGLDFLKPGMPRPGSGL